MKPSPLVLLMCLLTSAAAAADSSSIARQYGATAQKLIDAALADNHSTARLRYLCDRIGNRLSGSEALERAIEWAASEMKSGGLTNVQTPPVMVPHWVRGRESVENRWRCCPPSAGRSA
jgi:hypothetical protein